MATDYSK